MGGRPVEAQLPSDYCTPHRREQERPALMLRTTLRWDLYSPRVSLLGKGYEPLDLPESFGADKDACPYFAQRRLAGSHLPEHRLMQVARSR